MKTTENKCKNCKNWKKEQAELSYTKFYGICIFIKWKFETTGEGDCALLDRKNLSSKHMNIQRFENSEDIYPIGKKEKPQYCLVTEENFGCIHYCKKP